MDPQIFVIKKSGERESFQEEKVFRSMARVGLPEGLKSQVLEHIKSRLHQDIKTTEIFSHILEFLRGKHRPSSIRFNLKQAIFDLGPTGFPFEKYVARIFEAMEYKTQVDIIFEGECVKHEIDVLLEKDEKKEIVEVKFHNQPGTKTDIQVTLYSYARLLDVSKKNKIEALWVVTNTKLTNEAIHYSECKNIRSIAWNYPREENLQDLVEKPSLYPVTILRSLSSEDKKRLVEDNVVLCGEFLKLNEGNAKRLLINIDRFREAQEDAKRIQAI